MIIRKLLMGVTTSLVLILGIASPASVYADTKGSKGITGSKDISSSKGSKESGSKDGSKNGSKGFSGSKGGSKDLSGSKNGSKGGSKDLTGSKGSK